MLQASSQNRCWGSGSLLLTKGRASSRYLGMELGKGEGRPLGLVIKEETLCLVLWTPSPLIRCEEGDGQPGGAVTRFRRVTSSTHRGFSSPMKRS